MLLAHGWNKADLIHWFGHLASEDTLLQATFRHGRMAYIAGTTEVAATLVPPNAHALSLALPDNFEHNRWWWLLVVRKELAFSHVEQQILGLWLRQWMMRFAQPTEAQLHQWLVGHDQRIILADLPTQARLVHQPICLPNG